MDNIKTLEQGQQVIEKEGKTFVSGICRVTKEPYTTGVIDRAGLIDWLSGTPIQIALKGLSDIDRQFLITGSAGKLED